MKQNIKKGRYLFYEGEVYDLGGGGDSGEAMAKAEEALTAAQAAQTTADGAATAAGNAQSTANAAQTAANAAQTAADNAQTTADNAASAASAAQATADSKANNLETLWTNASPGSSFAGQTISLDLSNAKEVWVMFRARNNSVAYSWHKLTVDGGSYAYLPPIFYSGKAVERQTFAYTTGVTFQAGRYFNTYGGGRTDDNSYMIPIRIAVRR